MKAGGTQVGEVTRLGEEKQEPSFTCNLTTPSSRGALSQDWMVAKHVNKKNAGKPRVLVVNTPLHSHTAFAATFSAVAFFCCL